MLNLKARWIFPVDSEPIRDGVVRVDEDRIVAVEQSRGEQGAAGLRDLGNVAILPGWVNAPVLTPTASPGRSHHPRELQHP